MTRQLDAIDSLSTQIALADQELTDLARHSDECGLLMSVPGVGPLTAIRFLAAVDYLPRFLAAHRLQSYLGLTPGERSSSDAKRRTSLTKAGSKKVRWLLVQAAWCALRTRPHDPMVLWAQQIAQRRGRRIAIVALGRKLAGILFAILRDGTSYQPSRGSTLRAEKTPRIASGSQVLELARAASKTPRDTSVNTSRPSPDSPSPRIESRASSAETVSPPRTLEPKGARHLCAEHRKR